MGSLETAFLPLTWGAIALCGFSDWLYKHAGKAVALSPLVRLFIGI